MISIVYNPATFDDFEKAVKLLKGYEEGGNVQLTPVKNGNGGKPANGKGPLELEYIAKAGKRLRFSDEDKRAGRTREDVAKARLAAGDFSGGEGAEDENFSPIVDPDVDAEDALA